MSPELRIVRTKLKIGFTADATVGQLNDLLTSIGGQITSMLQGVNHVIVRIPDPGNMPALDALVAQIESSPVVRYVLRGYMGAPDALPYNVDVVTDPGLVSFIDHHLDVRAHAAWNVRNLIDYDRSPILVIADHFGNGDPALTG